MLLWCLLLPLLTYVALDHVCRADTAFLFTTSRCWVDCLEVSSLQFLFLCSSHQLWQEHLTQLSFFQFWKQQSNVAFNFATSLFLGAVIIGNSARGSRQYETLDDMWMLGWACIFFLCLCSASVRSEENAMSWQCAPEMLHTIAQYCMHNFPSSLGHLKMPMS